MRTKLSDTPFIESERGNPVNGGNTKNPPTLQQLNNLKMKKWGHILKPQTLETFKTMR